MPSELPTEFRGAWGRWAEEAWAAAAAAAAAELAAAGGGGRGGGGAGAGVSSRDNFVKGLLRSAAATAKGAIGSTAAAADTASAAAAAASNTKEDESWEADGDVETSGQHEKVKAAAAAAVIAAAAVSERLSSQYAAKSEDPAWRKMFAFRRNLPVAALQDELLGALRAGDAAVVCGETGSGKTTQVPQYLLDDAIKRGVGAGCRVRGSLMTSTRFTFNESNLLLLLRASV